MTVSCIDLNRFIWSHYSILGLCMGFSVVSCVVLLRTGEEGLEIDAISKGFERNRIVNGMTLGMGMGMIERWY